MRIVLCIAAFMMLVAFCGFAIPKNFSETISKSPLMFQDFRRYYAFGTIGRSAQRADLYDSTLQYDQQVALLREHFHGAIPWVYSWPIDYMPPLAILMAPVTVLPFPYAMLTSQLLGLVAAGAVIYLIRGKGWRDALQFLGGVVLCVFSFRALAIGQVTWLILAGIGLYFWSLLRGRSVLAGSVLALLAVVKVQYAVFFAIPLLPLIERKAIAAGAAVTLALFVASGLWLGWDAIWVYPTLLTHTQSHDPSIYGMINLRALADMAVGKPLSKYIALAIALGGMATTFAIWWKARRANDEARHWAVAATVCLAILTNFHAHNFDALFFAVGAAFTMPTLDLVDASGIRDRVVRVWTLSMLVVPLVTWPVMKIPDAHEAVRCVLFLLIATYLTALATWQFWRSARLSSNPH